MDIKFNDISKQWDVIKEAVTPKLDLLFQNSDFIGGKAIAEFEKNFADYIGTKFAIGVSNGTDALKICLASFNLESPCGVIIPANTYIATALSITYLSNFTYELKLIDCDIYYQMDLDLLEKCLKENRKKWKSCVIIPVHLFGHPANIEPIMELANKFDCLVLEDSSQAHGAIVSNKKVGVFGEMSAFSLYPGKNLGACGDAGIITTDDESLYDKAKSLRNFGSHKKYYYDFRGWNNRLDTIQATILIEKLRHLDEWNEKRIETAKIYNDLLDNLDPVITPKTASYVNKNVYHIYAIRIKKRDDLQKFLKKNQIPTIIHYPIAIQKTTPFQYLDFNDNKNTLQYADELLSLPIYSFQKEEEILYITDNIKKFYL